MSSKILFKIIGFPYSIIGTILGESSTDVTVDQPMVCVITETGGHSFDVSLMPYDHLDPKGAQLFSKSTMVSRNKDVPDKLEAMYFTASTGIQLADARDALNLLGQSAWVNSPLTLAIRVTDP